MACSSFLFDVYLCPIHSFIYSSSENLPGAIPVQIVSSMQKDRPAGTSWILPGGSSVDVTTAKTESQLDDEKGIHC
jgi:hypothetical protein